MYSFRNLIILLCSFLFIKYVLGDLRIDPLVDTSLGLIRGLRASDGDYSMFMGIPYARLREDNPFASAIPQEPFDDVFEAYDDSAKCPQVHYNKIQGTLDCLHLNVYVPNSASSRNRLPVMVWIHGGVFSYGYGGREEYGPKYLVRHEIILVTVNYRLGPYGFMCIDTPDVVGNQGLKDQLLALRWVKDNIEAFGGDPDKITVMGESAGGMSIDLHLVSPHEKLYNSAILQSGNSLIQTYPVPVKDASFRMAAYLGYETTDLDDSIAFLANVDPHEIIATVIALNLEFQFKPCVEHEYDNVVRFLPENWINTPVPKVRNLPILIGFTSHESMDTFGAETSVFYDSQIDYYLRFGFDVDDPAFTGMEDIVRQFYIGDEPISQNVKWGMIDFLSDYKFNYPTIRTIKRYIDNGAGHIYSYMFSYDGDRNFNKIVQNVSLPGACHADDLGYLFDMEILNQPPNAADQLMIDQMTLMWTNFAKYSDPTPEVTDILTSKWTPITPGSLHHYLDLDTELSPHTRPYSSRMTFWDLLYKVNYNLQRVAGDNINIV